MQTLFCDAAVAKSTVMQQDHFSISERLRQCYEIPESLYFSSKMNELNVDLEAESID
jgi:hypothetical protein